jgi:hypothetical protein
MVLFVGIGESDVGAEATAAFVRGTMLQQLVGE